MSSKYKITILFLISAYIDEVLLDNRIVMNIKKDKKYDNNAFFY